ncbi:MAG TPA: TetR family transcriptional regulator C-terminal domain-containing protein [Pseudonocardiaceae bacterium]|jgi:hypothetical protein
MFVTYKFVVVVQGDAVRIANTIVAMIDGLAIQVLLGSRNMTVPRMHETCLAYLRGLSR